MMSNVTIPPDIDTLRRLVRGELCRDETIQVDRWLIRCPDPRLPVLIENLVAEWEQEKADARLPQALAKVSRRFRGLWEAGRAFIDAQLASEAGPAPLLLSPRATDAMEGPLLFTTDDACTFAVSVVVGEDVARLVVLATNDRGDLHVLHDEILAPGSRRHVRTALDYRIDEGEGRVTLWVVVSPTIDSLPPIPSFWNDFLPWLDAIERMEGPRVYARRVAGAALLPDA